MKRQIEETEKMKKLRKLYELYLKQSNYQIAGNEWSKPLAFHVLLGQILRKPQPEAINATMPMTYLRAGKEISIREHLFVCQGARSGKGELMLNLVDVLNSIAEEAKWPDVQGHYMDGEPTAQFLRGGNENVGTKGGGVKWIPAPPMLKHYSILAWSEGESIVSPKSSYGDFKHVILSATDDGGKISVTARKDLVQGGKGVVRIPHFHTTCSIVTGSVYKDTFATEILQSGLLQRFLFSYYVPSFKKNLSQIKELSMGLIKEVGEEGEDARYEFIKYFMDDIHGQYLEEPVEWSAAGAERLVDILQERVYNPGYRGQKLDTYNAFVNSVQKHTEKIASAAAALEGAGIVTDKHVEYAWGICKVVSQSYDRLLGAKFLPDLSFDERRRIEVLQKMLSKAKDGAMMQKELMEKLRVAKKRGEWDLGHSSTFTFLKEMEKYGVVQTTRSGQGRGIFYRLIPY